MNRLKTLTLLITLCGSCLAQPAWADTSRQYSESAIGAALIYNVAKFARWPADAVNRRTESLVLCILGQDPFNTALQELEGKRIDDVPISVSSISAANEVSASGCHLLFVGRSEASRVQDLLTHTESEAILTIGAFKKFAESGGILGLTRENNTVTFSINAAASSKAGLKIGSQLLALANIVETKENKR